MQVAQPDEVLLRRFAEKGDETAFSEIVRRHAAMVYATCRRVLGDPARAEDVSQETFLRLMRKPTAVNHSLAGWLYTAASQLSIDAIRSDSARRHREAAYVEQVEQERGEVSNWKDISPHIDEALLELPEETRVLLVRHFLESRSQTELAKEYGTSISTISRHIRQGVDLLRAKLGRKGITVAVLVLTECLALDTAEAAPHTLISELGKMTMLSGSHAAPPVNFHPSAQASAKELLHAESVSRHLLIFSLGAVGAAVLGALFMFAWQHARQGQPLVNPPRIELPREGMR
jgi:RNA polymerase sigma factor (sigma-70 family)